MERASKVPITILIGGGSKLPPLIKAAKNPKSKFKISLVITHKKNSPGIDFALKYKIPAVYFNLVDYRTRVFKGSQKARSAFSKMLGWFISQKAYDSKLLVFVGWDLIMDENFFDFFKNSAIGNGYAAINLHPALMPTESEGRKVTLPDGSRIPTMKGEQQLVLESVLREKHTYFGPTVHYMNPKKFDTGKVIRREPLKVGSAKTVDQLRKKLLPVEDKILLEAIEEVVKKL